MFTPYQGISQIPRIEHPGKFSPNTKSLILNTLKKRKERTGVIWPAVLSKHIECSCLWHTIRKILYRYRMTFLERWQWKESLNRMTEQLQLAKFTTNLSCTEVDKERTNISSIEVRNGCVFSLFFSPMTPGYNLISLEWFMLFHSVYMQLWSVLESRLRSNMIKWRMSAKLYTNKRINQ